MADPFTIAGGAIALAGTGITIAKALKAYIDTVRKAEKRLRPVIRDVEVISGVLTQIGTQLENGEIRKLCTQHLYDSAHGAVESCREDFSNLDKFKAGLLNVEGGEIKMTTSAKLTLHFKQQELDTLQGHMGQSKASLNLVISILQVVIIMRTAPKDSVVVGELKVDVQHRLDEALEQTHKQYAPSTEVQATIVPQQNGEVCFYSQTPETLYKTEGGNRRAFGSSNSDITSREAPKSMESASTSNFSTYTSREIPLNSEEARTLVFEGVSLSTAPTWYSPQRLWSLHSSQAKSTRSTRISNRADDILLECLRDATRASSKLRFEVNEVINMWREEDHYDSRHLHVVYDDASRVFANLWAQEKSTPSVRINLRSSTWSGREGLQPRRSDLPDEGDRDPEAYSTRKQIIRPPPAHGPQNTNPLGQKPESRRLPGPPEPDAEPDYLQQRQNARTQLSSEAQEALLQADLFLQVEEAISGRSSGDSPVSLAPCYILRSPSYARSSGEYPNTNVVSGNLSPAPQEQQYSSDSDAETASGLAALQKAEEDEMQRQSRGPLSSSEYALQPSSSQQRFMPPPEGNDSDDDYAPIDMSAFGGGYDAVMTYGADPDAHEFSAVDELLRNWTTLDI